MTDVFKKTDSNLELVEPHLKYWMEQFVYSQISVDWTGKSNISYQRFTDEGGKIMYLTSFTLEQTRELEPDFRWLFRDYLDKVLLPEYFNECYLYNDSLEEANSFTLRFELYGLDEFFNSNPVLPESFVEADRYKLATPKMQPYLPIPFCIELAVRDSIGIFPMTISYGDKVWHHYSQQQVVQGFRLFEHFGEDTTEELWVRLQIEILIPEFVAWNDSIEKRFLEILRFTLDTSAFTNFEIQSSKQKPWLDKKVFEITLSEK